MFKDGKKYCDICNRFLGNGVQYGVLKNSITHEELLHICSRHDLEICSAIRDHVRTQVNIGERDKFVSAFMEAYKKRS